MKNLRRQKVGIVISLIICAITIVFSSLPISSAEKGSCEEALERCLSDVSLLFLYGGAGWIAYCDAGYIFCLKYIKK
ncbi:MAG: hypothetical protein ACPLPQ_10350 [Candidatus Saccharicenans sp.]